MTTTKHSKRNRRWPACGQIQLNYRLSTRRFFFGFFNFRNIRLKALNFVNMNLSLKINFSFQFVFYLKFFEKKSACGQIYLIYRLSTRICVRIGHELSARLRGDRLTQKNFNKNFKKIKKKTKKRQSDLVRCDKMWSFVVRCGDMW